MPRSPRRKSEFGYYHVTARGVGQQVLFEDPADYNYCLNLLKRFSLDCGVSVCAYCLMENHIHLLLYDAEENLSLYMKKLEVTYSRFYNDKYRRSGHLFQDRFGSVPIESEDQLLTVFRCILNNPRKAGICAASEYPWSSYSQYGDPHSFVDTLVLKELLGSFDEYAAYIAAKYEDEEDMPRDRSHDDEWALSELRSALNIPSGSVLKTWDLKKRNQALRILREKGLSIRQIERLTGIPRSIIQRA